MTLTIQETIVNPDFQTVARLEHFDSGRLYITAFRDGDFSHFGTICHANIGSDKHVTDAHKNKLCKSLGFSGHNPKAHRRFAHTDAEIIGAGLSTDLNPQTNALVFGQGENTGNQYCDIYSCMG